jgi:transcription elongation factor GreA
MAGIGELGHGDGMAHLTQTDFDALVCELDELRRKHRIELERRLRDARDFGSPADSDDVLTVFEEIAIDQSRIARLEDAVRSAVIVADGQVFDGAAELGCVVEVADGRRTEAYRLVGRRSPDADRHVVSLASPVGKALVGARTGDVVEVTLPGDRSRRLEVLRVSPPVVPHLRDVMAA